MNSGMPWGKTKKTMSNYSEGGGGENRRCAGDGGGDGRGEVAAEVRTIVGKVQGKWGELGMVNRGTVHHPRIELHSTTFGWGLRSPYEAKFNRPSPSKKCISMPSYGFAAKRREFCGRSFYDTHITME